MFKLTATTDPKTVMFEGHLDVTIAKITPADPYFGADRFYVFLADYTTFGEQRLAPGNNHAYNTNGEDQSGARRWPRLVLRRKFDPALPLIARGSADQPYEYELVGTFTPADGSEPTYRVRRKDGNGATLDIYASTGKVGSRGGAGCGLTFENGPTVTYDNLVVYANNGASAPVRLTLTDGVITNVEMVK